MTKGDIVWAKDTEQHVHPIVFLNIIDSYSFNACILSSKSTNGNLLMRPSHFCNNDQYDFRFKNTHLVITCTFIKMNNWINPNIVGRLTDEGIEFVDSHISTRKVLHDGPIGELVLENNNNRK
jgi:hypothetical protein